MKTKLMTLATLALALSPSLAFASGPTTAPEKTAKSNGTYTHSTTVHDRTPVIHGRSTSLPR